jgi:hypothetical protein
MGGLTGKSKTGEAGHKALIARAEARAAQPPPVVAEPQRHAEGRMAKSKSEGVNFHIEITVTRGEHAHVFKFDCGESTSLLQARDLSGCAGTLSI